MRFFSLRIHAPRFFVPGSFPGLSFSGADVLYCGGFPPRKGMVLTMKKLMLGNEAAARGLYEAGVTFASSYPGTPSTEITEYFSGYEGVHAEWAPNEKVACEAAFGASLAGARSFSAMKHVGLNVAADLLYSVSYTGVNGGMVVAVADDQGMHSSQNEQDSRNHAKGAKIPMLEPSDSAECRDYAKLAYEISETFDTPVFLRTSTRVAHSQSLVEEEERVLPPKKPYEKNVAKYVMMPAMARPRHRIVEERTKKLAAYAASSGLNRVIPGSGRIGVIAAGIAFQYAREALGDRASYLKLGMVYPLNAEEIRAFAATVEKLYVIEELDPFIEDFCRAAGIACEGKALFSLCGEYTPAMIRKAILGEDPPVPSPAAIPVRPPVLCPGCPHRGIFYVLHKMKLTVSGDIGCYTLGAQAPLASVDSTIDMGESVSGLHGFLTADPSMEDKTVAVIGDSTFVHSGITGLINAVYNRSNVTVLILDNSITGMTGHQQNPCTGLTLQNQPTHALDLEALCHAVGVRRVSTVDPYDLDKAEAILREELSAGEPSVVIVKRPCALLKWVKRLPPLTVDPDKCRKCRKCMSIGCPAVLFSKETGASIDRTLCVGCGLCEKLCPFGTIEGGQNA